MILAWIADPWVFGTGVGCVALGLFGLLIHLSAPRRIPVELAVEIRSGDGRIDTGTIGVGDTITIRNEGEDEAQVKMTRPDHETIVLLVGSAADQ